MRAVGWGCRWAAMRRRAGGGRGRVPVVPAAARTALAAEGSALLLRVARASAGGPVVGLGGTARPLRPRLGRGAQPERLVRRCVWRRRRGDEPQWPRAGEKGQERSRSHLVLGPWVHGVPSATDGRAGDLDFGPVGRLRLRRAGARLSRPLRPRHCQSIREGARRALLRRWASTSGAMRPRGRPPRSRVEALYLGASGERSPGHLRTKPSADRDSWSAFRADPQHPVVDPHGSPGAHDYRALAARDDVLTFDTEPLTLDELDCRAT